MSLSKLRGFLAPLSLIYGSIIFVRNKLFDFNILKAQKPDIFTISVGNLSMGGTGKTQVVIYLANAFKDLNPCIVLRGYKRKSKETMQVLSSDTDLYGDEAVEIFLKTKAKVVVAFKRIEGAKICKSLGSKLIILDDAFSHRWIKRDLDFVLIPANKPKDYIFPMGNLREYQSAIKRADAIIITRLESYQKPNIDINKPIFEAKAMFKGFLDKDFNYIDAKSLKNKTFDVVCAIGDPEQFIYFVKNLSKEYGFNIDKIHIFKDHHDYKKHDLEYNKEYICTPKDLVKLRNLDYKLISIDASFDIPHLIDFIKQKYEAK